MASVFAIAIVPLLIARGLELDTTESAYLVSMALMVSGVATFIQSRRIGPVGSGLLCLQGTSFTFVATIVAGDHALGHRFTHSAVGPDGHSADPDSARPDGCRRKAG